MYIGLISDTHGTFDDAFRKFLEPVDEIWHAGDFGGGFTTAAEIAAFKPLLGVIGNCDDRRLIYDYPAYRYWKCEGLWVAGALLSRSEEPHQAVSPRHFCLRALPHPESDE